MRSTVIGALTLLLFGCGVSVVGSQSAESEGTPSGSTPDPTVPGGGGPSPVQPGSGTGSSSGSPPPSPGATQLDYASSTPPSGTIDLTTGTLDWMHWGEEDQSPFINRKNITATGTPLIGELKLTGAALAPAAQQGDGYATTFKWTDAVQPGLGSVDAEESGSTDFIYWSGVANLGLEISIAAAPQLRKAEVYLGNVGTSARFDVDFDDGSLPVGTATIAPTANTGTLFTIDFRHPTAGTKLRVRWTMLDGGGSNAIRLIAVVVK